MPLRFAAAAFLLLLAGCAQRKAPLTWQFQVQERGHVLLPPRAAPASPAFVLKNARALKNGAAACNIQQPHFSLRWKGRHAHLTADTNALNPIPGTDVAGPNWVVRSFRPALKQSLAARCFTPPDLPVLDHRVIENLGLPSSQLYRLHFGEFVFDGYLDVGPGFRLRTVEPIRDAGVVTGYLTAFYLLQPAPTGGVLVSPGTAERNVPGSRTAVPVPDSELLHLPPNATWFRFYFRSWSVSGDRRIALIAAPSPEERDRAARDFEANPETYCTTQARERGVACIAVPKDMVLGPELRVRLNGQDAYVPVAGSLRDLAREAGVREPSTLLPKLAIARPYEGKLVPVNFDRTRQDIFGLVLIGGEEITW